MFKYLIPLDNFNLNTKYDKNILIHKNEVRIWNKRIFNNKSFCRKKLNITNRLLNIPFSKLYSKNHTTIKINLIYVTYLFLNFITVNLNINLYYLNKISRNLIYLTKYGVFSKYFLMTTSSNFFIKNNKLFNIFFKKKPINFYVFFPNYIKLFKYTNNDNLDNWLPNFNFTYKKELYYKKNRKQYYFKLVFLSSHFQNFWTNFIREYLRKYKLVKKLLYWGYMNKKLKISGRKLIYFLSKQLNKELKNPINTIL